jgi:uncharacterized Zn finger protein
VSDWRYPPPSHPRTVEGGLRASGAISKTWWSSRFISVLEDIGMGNRLRRGRSYARSGQVISLDVAAGVVSAQVQGSRTRPYRSWYRFACPSSGAAVTHSHSSW